MVYECTKCNCWSRFDFKFDAKVPICMCGGSMVVGYRDLLPVKDSTVQHVYSLPTGAHRRKVVAGSGRPRNDPTGTIAEKRAERIRKHGDQRGKNNGRVREGYHKGL
jgi:hypothetical protein